MSIRFILGRSGTGKTRTCLDEIVEELVRGEKGPALIWLVPEQATYQIERAVLCHPQIRGFSRLRVLSFNRLCFHLLGQTTGRQELSRIGRRLLLGRVLTQCRERLQVLQTSVQHAGMAEALTEWVCECQQENCTPADLRTASEQLPAGSVTAHKLQDLAVIVEAYEGAVAQRDHALIDTGLDMGRARRAIREATWLHGSHLWIDGFAGFTQQEWDLLAELLRCSSRVAMALCLDPDTLDPQGRDPQALDPESLFATTEETYVTMAGLCDRLAVPIAPPEPLTRTRRFRKPALAAIESSLYGRREAPPRDVGTEGVSVWAAPHPRAEIDAVARQIEDGIRNQGWRYRDIAVVLPDLTAYQAYVEASFGDAEIPFFLDRPLSLVHHPLVVLLRSVLRAVLEGFRTADVLALLKTDLGPLDRTETDALEHYCRTVGIEGSDWFAADPWTGAQEQGAHLDDVLCESLRQRIKEPLIRLSRSFARENLGAAEFIRALWRFVTDLKVPETLAAWTQQRGDTVHGQVLEKVVDLADQWVAVLGDDRCAPVSLANAWEQGLQSLTVTQIPPTLDQVLVGTIERSRHPDVRAVFLVGVTQKLFPTPLSFDTLLTDADRNEARQRGLSLRPPQLEVLNQRPYLTYIALTRASEFLGLSYPATDARGAMQEPALVIAALQALLPALTVTHTVLQEPEIGPATGPIRLADRLCQSLQRTDAPEVVARAAHIVAALAALELEPLRRVGQWLRQALAYANDAALAPDQPARLHGACLTGSATALETYAACPYRYFAAHVLRLKPRRPLSFDALDSGDLYHRVLDRLFRDLQDRQQSLRDLEATALRQGVTAAFDAVVREDARWRHTMERDGHSRYLVERLHGVLQDCVRELAEMSRAGRFTPAATELSFGERGTLPALQRSLPGERALRLEGRIDRVDLCGEGEQVSALVFDYKRGSTGARFDLGRWYHGLSLQTVLYTLVLQDVTLDHRQVKRCVGAFLVPVEIPLASQTFSETVTPAFWRKARGLFDGSAAEDLDTHPGNRGSRFYAFYTKKAEGPYGRMKDSSAAQPAVYQRILRHTEQMLQTLAGRILDGDIGIHPYALGQDTPCTFCDFQALCKFDWQITPPRQLTKWGRTDVLRLLEESDD